VTAEPENHHAQLAIARACMLLQVPFFWRGPGTMIIAGSGRPAVLSWLAEHGYQVIGLEGFDVAEVRLQPRLDLIYDASRSPASAQAFSSGWPPDAWVDITLDARSVGR
jgi:hypothetical protein